MRHRIVATALLSLLPAQTLFAQSSPSRRLSGATAAAATALELPFFGPQQYVRTTGPQNVYSETISVPPWLVAPFRLHVDNGAPDGSRRVSSGIVEVNGTAVLTQSDFNQNVGSFNRNVTLTPATSLKVTLASQPASYLSLTLFGTTADLTPPVLTWVDPANGTTINTALPRLLIKYADVAGTNEPAAAGVDLASLQVFVDDVDRTSLFTRRSDEATAIWPQSLPLSAGRHTFKASISDFARNRREVSGEFRVDLTRPTIDIVQPEGGAYLPTRTPPVRIRYTDEAALNLGSLQVLINGVDLTALFTKAAGEATIAWNGSTILPEGVNHITAHIRDLGGNEATDSTSFNVDVRPPQFSIAQPLNGQRIGSRDVAIRLTYTDDQAVAVNTAAATVDGNAVTLTRENAQATGVAMALADTPHNLKAHVADRAGNVANAEITFIVDTTVPKIEVVEPPAGAKVKVSAPPITIRYSDEQGIDPTTFKVQINAVDRTLLFVQDNTSSSARLTGFNLPEGVTEVAAEIRDVTANIGRTVSSFFVDTVPPAGTIEAPAARVNSSAPAFSVTYSDAGGSGIDPTSVRLFVDGAERTNLITATAIAASGVLDLQPPLIDGQHEVRVTFGDQAGNLTTLTRTFVIDTRAAALTVLVPQNDSFINTTTPALRISYSDVQGTGVDLPTFKLFLRKGANPETDITSYVTVGPLEATGIVPDASRLSDGTYRIRAQVRDLAGNVSNAEVAFEVDTVAPTYVIESPAANAYVASVTPAFVIRYEDELSGVDTARAIVRIDDIDRTVRFTFAADRATGTLLPAEALTQGLHKIEFTLYDRAGNRAPVAPQNFTVDTIAPTAAVELPLNGSYIPAAPHAFRLTYADGTGSGIDPASVRVLIDGVNRTAEFTITATQATAQIAPPLPDGAHTVIVSALDWAGNAASATSTFKVDSVVPAVQINSPTADSWLKGPTITVTGTITDASPTVTEVNGIVASTTNGTFTASVPTTEGPFTITVICRDAAGNTTTRQVSVKVDSAPPVITVAQPAAGFVTKNQTTPLSGTVTDASTVTLTLNGQPLPLTGNAFSTDLALTVEGINTFTLVATDAATNSRTATVTPIRDTIAPSVTVASPIKDAVVGALPLVVRGTLTDATSTTITVNGTPATITAGAWETSLANLAEAKHTLTVVATDAGTNTTTVTQDVTIDLTAPLVVITSPLAGTFTKELTAIVTGTATDISLVSVKSGAVTATLQAGSTDREKLFTLTGVPLVEGDNTVRVVATDAIARTTEATVLVTRDTVLPTITLAGPDQITRSRGVKIIATAADNLVLKDVVFKLGETELLRRTAPPFELDFIAPATANVGDTLTITAIATDKALNTATATKPIRFVAEGAITGQVLNDVTGLPIAGANVRLTGSTTKETGTDEKGRYAFPVNDQNVTLTITSTIAGSPATTVERVIGIQSGVGTVPVDARLTSLGPRSVVTSSGGRLIRGNVIVDVPSGAVPTTTYMRLTTLTPQGLPNLLPLGWSPAVAFDFMSEGPLTTPVTLTATISNLTAPTLHFVAYKATTHAWSMVQSGVPVTGGSATVTFSEPGTYAIASADDPAVPIAAPGALLEGVPMVPIPDTATSSGSVTPPTLPTTGGSAVGSLIVKSPAPLPSGTVVQAEVTETFSMSSGEIASEEKRSEDLILYRKGADVAADFPIVPSRTFTANDLLEGRVHLDILAGREMVRGKTGGGLQAVTLPAGAVNVTVPAGALPNDVAIAARPSILSSFLPSTANAVAVAEVVLDFSGFTLTTPAELSINADNIPAGETVVVARIDRVLGVPKAVVVAGTNRVSNRFVSTTLTGFPGILTEGRYVFYRINVPWGIVGGSLTPPLAAVTIQIANLPFTAITNVQGTFVAVAAAGTAQVSASVPGTSLAGSATVGVVAGQTSNVALTVAAKQTVATVTPANGATRVPVSTQIEITASAPLNAASAAGAQLRREDGAIIPTRIVLSGSGRVLALVPLASLQPGVTYTATFTGLADIYGGAVAVAPASFTTQPETAPSYDTNKIVFSMPDANGMVRVSAPAGSLPPGTRVLIVNSGNGNVVSYTVGNDGSFSGDFPATIEDTLLVTITDPKGNVVNFERSKYVFNDGSGRVAIGPGGGTVEGTGGTEIRIPAGALNTAAVFKVEGFGPEVYPERPEFPGAHFGSGLRITSEQKPTLNTEGDLVFPRPADAPEGAFFYVYKRLTGPNGMVGFQTIDIAFPDGQGKVVTSSFPYIGWGDSVDSWKWTAEMENVGNGIGSSIVMFMMWTYDALFPGVALPGAISGRVLRPVWKAGATEPEYVGVSGALVVRAREGSAPFIFPTFASTNGDGWYTLLDPKYTGGTVDVVAAFGPDKVVGTAFEANPQDTKTLVPLLGKHHRHVANLNLTFPATSAPPPAPDITVHLMTLDGQGKRQAVNGIAIANVPLIVGFKINNGIQAEIRGATIGAESVSVRPDFPGTQGMPMDFVVGESFIPTAAGTYQLHTTAINPLGGAPVDVDFSFLVIASGGNNAATVQNAAPDWITARLVPKQNEAAVPLDAVPQVVFTEPVTKVMENFSFSTSSGDVPVTVSAVAVQNGTQFVVNDLKVAPASTAVISLTVQPLGGLDLNKKYKLELRDGIQDLDTDAAGNPQPKHFPGRKVEFTTIAGSALGSATDVRPANLVILGSHAYVAERNPDLLNTFLKVYDLADQQHPKMVAMRAVSGQAIDVAGELHSSVNDNEAAVVVGSGLKIAIPGPSNLYMFDVRHPESPRRAAVVSLTESAQHGSVLRVYLHGRYAYTITYPHGVQVIDMQLATAMHDAADNDPVKSQERARAIVTEGVGWGQEAVVNSIPVRQINGQLNHVLDLAIDEFVVNGAPQTMVLGTGTFPYLAIDPTAVGTSAIRSTTVTAGPGAGSLTSGRAIALTTVGTRRVAVIAGQGSVGAGSVGPIIAVVDVTDPLAAKLIGSHLLPGEGMDIVAQGTRALVSTGSTTYAYSLADPTKPRFIGEIARTGGRISLDADGGTLVGNMRDGAQGLHTAIFHPLLLIDRVEPIRTHVASAEGQPLSTQKVVIDAPGQGEDPIKIKVRVLPPNIAKQVKLRLINRSFPDQNNIPKPDNVILDNVVLDVGEDGIAERELPAGLTLEDTDLIATATAATTVGGEMRSLPRQIKLGWVKLTVDSNNNTDIDKDDREAARKGRAFGFWESDPNYKLKKPVGKFAEDEPLKALTDYFTVRITVNKPWTNQGSGGSLFLHFEKGTEKPVWHIVRKVDGGRDYLSDADAAERQKAEIIGDDPNATPECSPLNGRLHATTTECHATSQGWIELPKELVVGDHEFLVRCEDCKNRKQTDLISVPKIWLEYSTGAAGSGSRIDEAKADIRPHRQWITFMSARPVLGTGYRPLAKLNGETPLSSRIIDAGMVDPPSEQRNWANDSNFWKNKESKLPPNARDVTVIVHGYNVPDSDFRNKFLPSYFKRLYWVGHPIMRTQGEWRKPDDAGAVGCVKNCAHAVGISWPSNHAGTEPKEKGAIGSAISAGAALIDFAEDEFLAFQSGPSIAKYLKAVSDDAVVDRSTKLIAHSLGNLAVNSALSRPEIRNSSKRIVDRYVMNEAAMPAEAMRHSYTPDEELLTVWGTRHPENYGFEDDQPWINDWATINANAFLLGLWGFNVDALSDQAGLTLNYAQMYTQRWRQRTVRPLDGAPDSTSSPVPARGPWRGLFEANNQKTHIFNTWSDKDRILSFAWVGNQRAFKPFTGRIQGLVDPTLIPGIAQLQQLMPGDQRRNDNAWIQRWAMPHRTKAEFDLVFEENPSGSAGKYWNIKRQWAELSFWFPATSKAAGATSRLTNLLARCADGCPTNFTEYSPNFNISSPVETFLLSHGYLGYAELPKVWPAYAAIKKMFDRETSVIGGGQ